MILQFGTSRFLQAHVDLFAHEARVEGQPVPDILIAQTTLDPGRTNRLRGFADPAGFEVRICGIEHGEPVQRSVQVRSVVDGLAVAHEWNRLRTLFINDVDYVVSNTGDNGYKIADADRGHATIEGECPSSFPAMLLSLLHARWNAGGQGITILPCELVRLNGSVLRELVLGLAADVGSSSEFLLWAKDECIWTNTLVDRIVSAELQPAGAVAEPYALWVVERQQRLKMPFAHPSITITDDIERYERLKLHILNLGHSYLAELWSAAHGGALDTVRDLLKQPAYLDALQVVYDEEVVPGFVAHGMEAQAKAYVLTTLERFRNPFLDHRIADIHQAHASKVAKRISAFVEWADSAPVAMMKLPKLRALAAKYGNNIL